ncbi:hypothetical protein FRC09_003096 [Ceratobasidium sp. 395]|nr:hypothetical protein FRC09_003096 [Ceratobasidium sp. 395]
MTTRTTRRPSAGRQNFARALNARRSSKRGNKGAKEDTCTCGEERVGAPILRCGVCLRWYHFQCVELAERDAEDLAYYVCPTCTTATGKVSRELWELDDNEVPEIQVEDDVIATEPHFPQSSDDEGSEDNFVVEEVAVPVLDTASDHSENETIGARAHRRGARKRKSISKPVLDASAKRHKIEERTKSPSASPSGSAEDPIRKSCLKLLVNLLTPIFSERLPEEPDPPAESGNAEQFATSLEACVFEIYAEQGEYSEKSPGNKYKERVRMLNFNLGKKDRQELRKSIRVGQITPEELSRMSSIDLANAHAQQEAQKLAEEAMNHSILQARTAPLRKITHKGEQMIEKSVEEETWRIQEEESAREREREQQRTRVGSISESVPPATPVSASFRRASLDFPPAASPPVPRSTDKSFDPASAVFNMDFDGENSSMLNNGPATPPELSGNMMDFGDTMLGGNTHDSPSSPSTSPTVQNFSLDELFGSSEPVLQSWNEPSEGNGSTGPHSVAGDDPMAADDADFDAFITADEEGPEPPQTDEGPETTDPIPMAEPLPPPPEREPSLADLPALWRGHLGMPSMTDASRMIQFQSEFKQIGGAAFNDTPENRQALFPASLFEIIGRVPTAQAVKYLVSMRLNPTKELFAVALVPSEVDKPAYTELHKLLVGKDRYGLVFPWGQDPQLSAPGKEFYIAPLLPEHPVPEYLQLLDNVKIPEKRDSPIFCGVFVLNKGRVTSLNSLEHPHHSAISVSHAPPPVLGPPPPLPAAVPAAPAPPVSLLGISPVVAPALSNLSESTLATLTKDIANLNPTQLELVRTLLLQQPAPAPAPAAPLAPMHTTGGSHSQMPSHFPPSSAPSSSASPAHPPAQHAPASWDRPLESNWIPGPGYYAREEHREERPHYNRGENRGDPRTYRGRGGHSSYRGRGNRGGGGGGGGRW